MARNTYTGPDGRRNKRFPRRGSATRAHRGSDEPRILVHTHTAFYKRSAQPDLCVRVSCDPVLRDPTSLASLVFMVSCDIPAAVQHRELSRELASVHQGHYSVHLLWQETAGGALGPHGLGLEQRMSIAPGLYVRQAFRLFRGSQSGEPLITRRKRSKIADSWQLRTSGG